MNLWINVIYRNKKMEPVYEYSCPVADYAESLSMDIKRIVGDVEDLAYLVNGNKPKDEWSEAEIIAFNKIRSKLLDKAGEIGRLPENIIDKEQEKAPATFWGKVFSEKGV